jgi:hypothetical protein
MFASEQQCWTRMVQEIRRPTQAERRKIHGIVTPFQLLLSALLTRARLGLSISRPLVRRPDRARTRARHNPEPIMTRQSRIAFIAAVATFAATRAAHTQSVAKPDTSGYIAANGVNYWFEIRGKGEPLVLLHGGLFTTEGSSQRERLWLQARHSLPSPTGIF